MKHYCPKCMSYNLKELGLNIICSDCGEVIHHDDIEAIFDAEEENLERENSVEKYLLLDKLISILKMFFLDHGVDRIKLKEYFNVPKDIAEDYFYYYSEEELASFKPYRTKPVDDLFFNTHSICELYMTGALKNDLDRYFNNLKVEGPDLYKAFEVFPRDKMNYGFIVTLGNNKITIPNLSDKSAYKTLCEELSLNLFNNKTATLYKSITEIKNKNIPIKAEAEEYFFKGLFKKKEINRLIDCDKFLDKLEAIVNTYVEFPNISKVVNKYIEEYKNLFNKKLDEFCNYSGKYYSYRYYSEDIFPKVEEHFFDFDLIVIISLILDDFTDDLDEAIRMLEDEEFGDCPMYSAEDLEIAVRLLGVALKKDNPQIEDYIYSLHGKEYR